MNNLANAAVTAPFNGAVTGAFSRLFNAEGHPSSDASEREAQQRLAEEKADAITERGYISSKAEADALYSANTNPDLAVTVDASNLTASVDGAWLSDPNGGLRAPGHIQGSDYAIHGQVTLHQRTDGTVGIYDQKYDFEMQKIDSITTLARNVATFLGRPAAGGTPFTIRYAGNVKIGD